MPTELVSLGGLALALLLFALAGDGPAGSRRGDSGARWAKRRDLTVLSARGRADRSARGGRGGDGAAENLR